MKLFHGKKPKVRNEPQMLGVAREQASLLSEGGFSGPLSYDLYRKLLLRVPLLSAAISKIVRLSGGVTLHGVTQRSEEILRQFSENIPSVGGVVSLQNFLDLYLENLLIYGNAFGELVYGEEGGLEALYLSPPDVIRLGRGVSFIHPNFYVQDGEEWRKIAQPQHILFTALHPTMQQPYGQSVLQGLPALSSVLLRIYECIGQNYDRAGNVRYAVTYKPTEQDRGFARERASQIAEAWSQGVQGAKYGQLKDFVAVGDVDIKVIGSENKLMDTEIPVRQILEQLLSKLSIPPFLLGLNWSSTERMSSQQADILTSELEYYRRLLTPVVKKIGEAVLRSYGILEEVSVEWSLINLQDTVELAEARLKNAQAKKIEMEINEKEK